MGQNDLTFFIERSNPHTDQFVKGRREPLEPEDGGDGEWGGGEVEGGGASSSGILILVGAAEDIFALRRMLWV